MNLCIVWIWAVLKYFMCYEIHDVVSCLSRIKTVAHYTKSLASLMSINPPKLGIGNFAVEGQRVNHTRTCTRTLY